MRIGIYFTASHKNGGVYQYSLGFLEALAHNKSNDYVIITTSPDIPAKYLRDKRFQVINLASSSVLTHAPRFSKSSPTWWGNILV